MSSTTHPGICARYKVASNSLTLTPTPMNRKGLIASSGDQACPRACGGSDLGVLGLGYKVPLQLLWDPVEYSLEPSLRILTPRFLKLAPQGRGHKGSGDSSYWATNNNQAQRHLWHSLSDLPMTSPALM